MRDTENNLFDSTEELIEDNKIDQVGYLIRKEIEDNKRKYYHSLSEIEKRKIDETERCSKILRMLSKIPKQEDKEELYLICSETKDQVNLEIDSFGNTLTHILSNPCQRMGKETSERQRNALNEYLEVLTWLDIDCLVKNEAGYTPLDYCLSSPTMTKLLLDLDKDLDLMTKNKFYARSLIATYFSNLKDENKKVLCCEYFEKETIDESSVVDIIKNLDLESNCDLFECYGSMYSSLTFREFLIENNLENLIC